MHDTIAIIHAVTKQEPRMRGDGEFTKLYKIEIPQTEDDEPADQAALFEYQTSYVYLESLDTNDPDEAIAAAKERIPDYVLDSDLVDIQVSRR